MRLLRQKKDQTKGWEVNDRIPEQIIVQDLATKRFLVCQLEVVDFGIPFYKPIPGRVYQMPSDAIRGASFKPATPVSRAEKKI